MKIRYTTKPQTLEGFIAGRFNCICDTPEETEILLKRAISFGVSDCLGKQHSIYKSPVGVVIFNGKPTLASFEMGTRSGWKAEYLERTVINSKLLRL